MLARQNRRVEKDDSDAVNFNATLSNFPDLRRCATTKYPLDIDLFSIIVHCVYNQLSTVTKEKHDD